MRVLPIRMHKINVAVPLRGDAIRLGSCHLCLRLCKLISTKCNADDNSARGTLRMGNTYEPLTLDLEYCRGRQQRLLAVMQRLDVERAVLFQPEHVQYFTGFRPGGLLHAAVSLDADGHCLLVAPNNVPEHAAADDVLTFEAQWHCTLRQDQREAIAAILQYCLEWAACCAAGGCGVLQCGPPSGSAVCRRQILDVEPELWGLRRAKDPDELAMIRRAIACTEAMYARAAR